MLIKKWMVLISLIEKKIIDKNVFLSRYLYMLNFVYYIYNLNDITNSFFIIIL